MNCCGRDYATLMLKTMFQKNFIFATMLHYSLKSVCDSRDYIEPYPLPVLSHSHDHG